MPSYNFIAGTTGSVQIGTFGYPADSWEWRMFCSQIEVPTVSSMPYVDMASGAKKLVFRASGTAASDFNPFAKGCYLRTYQNVVVTGVNVAGRGVTMASGKVMIAEWNYRDEADGKCSWQLTAYGAWQFQNLNQTYN